MTIKSYKDLQGADLEAMAQAAEADAGQAIPGLRESLAELAAGKFATVHTPESIVAANAAKNKGGRPKGSVKANAKVPTNVRFDPEVLEALKASGPGWQTRLNDLVGQAVAGGRFANRHVMLVGGQRHGQLVEVQPSGVSAMEFPRGDGVERYHQVPRIEVKQGSLTVSAERYFVLDTLDDDEIGRLVLDIKARAFQR